MQQPPEPYRTWQKLVLASLGLAFAAGATVMLGLLTDRFPAKNKDRER